MGKQTYNHRFFDRVKEDYLKGATFFYLYGNSLFDDFFENVTLFTANAIDSLAFNLFVQLKVKQIFLIEKDKGISEFQINPNNNKIEWKNLSYEELVSISGNKKRSSSPTDNLRKNPQNENVPSAELSCSCGDTGLLNLFRVMTEILKNSKHEVAVIVNS